MEKRMDARGVLRRRWGSASHHCLCHGSLFFMHSCGEEGPIRPSLQPLCLLHLCLFFKNTHTHGVASVCCVCFTASLTHKHDSSSHQLRVFTDLYGSFNEGREGGTGLKHVALKEGHERLSKKHLKAAQILRSFQASRKALFWEAAKFIFTCCNPSFSFFSPPPSHLVFHLLKVLFGFITTLVLFS